MRIFYEPLDMRSRTALTEYLKRHFRYHTMNSWNRSTSYACNLKIHNLKLDAEVADKLYDMIKTQEFFDVQEALLDEFGRAHGYCWQARMNGRSGGYLVLYQGEVKPSGYRSYCAGCGQKNYRAAEPGDNICGACRKPLRVNYPVAPMQVTLYPGRGTDDDADYEDWSMKELRDRARLVQGLDQLADHMVAEAVYLAQHFTVSEAEYFVPKKRKVMIPDPA